MRGTKMLGFGGVVIVALASVSARADRTRVLCPAALNEFVSAETPAIRKHCYEPALKYGNMPAEANVIIDLTFDEKGQVQSSSVAANNGPPQLGACIAMRLRNWKPPCGPATKFPVSFSFTKETRRR